MICWGGSPLTHTSWITSSTWLPGDCFSGELRTLHQTHSRIRQQAAVYTGINYHLWASFTLDHHFYCYYYYYYYFKSILLRGFFFSCVFHLFCDSLLHKNRSQGKIKEIPYCRHGILSRGPSEELLPVDGWVGSSLSWGLEEAPGVGRVGVCSPPGSGESTSLNSHCIRTSKS